MASNPSLTKLKRRLGGYLTKQVKANAPNHLKDGITSSTIIDESNKRVTISVLVDMKKAPAEDGTRGHKDARAQEYGSGLHSTKGTPATYKILPKKSKVLMFPWQPAEPMAARGSSKYYGDFGGRWMFTEVDHPGIAPYKGKGYLRISIEKARPYIKNVIRETIGEDFVLSRHVTVKKNFGGG
jgi:hypothetical protein